MRTSINLDATWGADIDAFFRADMLAVSLERPIPAAIAQANNPSEMNR
jgi:hypothetical protein